HLVRRRHLELSRDDVPGDGELVLRLGREHETSSRTSTQTILAHQSGDALAGNAVTSSTQVGMDPGAAVAMTASLERSADVGQENVVAHRLPRRGALEPGVVSRGRDAEHPAHERHREQVGVGGEYGVLHDWLFAKYAAVFFRKSRSCSTTRSS